MVFACARRGTTEVTSRYITTIRLTPSGDLQRRLPSGREDAAYSRRVSTSIEKLRTTCDDDRIRLHDEVAQHTVVGTDYFMEELHRRSELRAMESSNRLAHRAIWLSAANAALAL